MATTEEETAVADPIPIRTPAPAPPTPDEQRQIAEVLNAEYGILAGAVASAWSASLVRTSLFLAVLSAAGVALGFAAQAGGFGRNFTTFALVVLPLVLFLGIATFVRTVEIQRELIVYITGMNRIRHFLQASVPASKPYFVLPAHDDERALHRGLGTGMHRGPPRFELLSALLQTQGIVGIISGVVAAAFAGLAAGALGEASAWTAAAATFVVFVAVLLWYWRRSLHELRARIRPISPTPPDEVDAPI
jgi:hypothetical protein